MSNLGTEMTPAVAVSNPASAGAGAGATATATVATEQQTTAAVGTPVARRSNNRSNQQTGTLDDALAFGRKTGYQCAALSLKNVILLTRNWKSSLLIVFAPAIVVMILGFVKLAEQAAAAAGQRDPPVFATLDSSSSAGFPPCRIFDNRGGRYGYGRAIPGAPCTSLMFAPSNDAEVVSIVQNLVANNPTLNGPLQSGLTSAATVESVVAHEVVGMATASDMNTWLGVNANLGYVGMAVEFNITSASGPIGYTLKYNATAMDGSFYGTANLDGAYSATSGTFDAMVLRAQRALDEAIITTRSNAQTGSSAVAPWLKLRLKSFPKFPFDTRYAEGYSIEDFTALFFYIAIMVIFMLSIVTVVDEKERGLLGAMRTVGLVEFVYWLSWLGYYAILLLVSTLLMCLVGQFFGTTIPFFHGTDFGVQFVIFYTYGMSMVMNAFAYAALLPRFTPAVSVGGTLFFLGLIVQLIFALAKGFINTLLMDPLVLSKAQQAMVYAYPPLGFGTVMGEIVTATKPRYESQAGSTLSTKVYPRFTWDNYTGSGGDANEYLARNITSLFCPSNKRPDECFYHYDPLSQIIGGMVPTALISFVLAWYLGQIFTGGHGRGQWPWFVIWPGYWFNLKCGGRSGRRRDVAEDPEQDDDVREETRRCRSGDASMAAVRVADLHKKFGRFKAVDGLCVSMPHEQIFALLGHNGAGKTTSIKMMTGLMAATEGEIDVAGFDVGSETAKVRGAIGVCPQHDVLWGQLTAREHLTIYSLLKSRWGAAAKQDIVDLLDGVKLADVQNKAAGKYSGGMRRRLSVAIAAVGDPQVMFLDEPTTGMDPMSRQHVWDMIQRIKKNRAIVLTTHSMEEADALGDRIGIMSEGKLVAIGSSLHLKNKFGAGYRIKLVSDTPAQAIDAVQRIVPAAQLVDDSAGSLSFAIPPAALPQLPQLIEWVEQEKEALNDWGISHTTLEEVFIRLARPVDEVAMPEAVAVPTVATEAAGDKGSNAVTVDAEPATGGETKTLDTPQAVAVAGKITGSTTGAKFKALFQQRAIARLRHKRFNLILCMCPAISMLLLLLATFGLDQILVANDNASDDQLARAKMSCDNCQATARTACLACRTTAGGSSGPQTCSQDPWTFNYEFTNEWGDSYSNQLEDNDHLRLPCAGCAFCRELDAAGSRHSHTWNNTHFHLPSGQYSGSSYVGCDALYASVCGSTGDPQMCWCNATAAFEALRDNTLCLSGCRAYVAATTTSLTVEEPYRISGLVDPVVTAATGSETWASVWQAVPTQTSPQIAVAGDTAQIRQLLGTRPGGPVNGTDTWSVAITRDDQSSSFGGSVTSTQVYENWVPVSTRNVLSRTVNQTLYDEIQAHAQQLYGSGTGLLRHFSQIVTEMGDQGNSQRQKICNGASGRETCSEACSCTDEPDSWYYIPPFNENDEQLCADPACGQAATACPADFQGATDACNRDQASWNGTAWSVYQCRTQFRYRQHFYRSPNYVSFASQASINDLVWASQSTTNDFGSTPEMATEATKATAEAVDARFPGAAMIFHELDTSANPQVDVTLQSYYVSTMGVPFYKDYGKAKVTRNINPQYSCIEGQASLMLDVLGSSNVPSFVRVGNAGAGGGSSWTNKVPAVSGANVLLNELSTAILKDTVSPSLKIDASFAPLPYPTAENAALVTFVQSFQTILGMIFIGGAMAILLPSMLNSIVREKELRLKAMMRMMGMPMMVYWVVTFLWSVLFQLVAYLWLFLVCVIVTAMYSNGNALGRSEPGLMILLLILWTLSQTSFAIAWSTLYSRYKNTSLHGFGFQFVALLMMMVLNLSVFTTTKMPAVILLIPHAGLFRAIYLLHQRSYFTAFMEPDDEMYTIMLFLFLDWIIYGVLAAYLDQIIPTNDGVNKHPCFCFLDLRRRFSRNQRANRVGDETADDILLQHRRHVSSIVDRESKEADDRAKDVTTIHEDADVIAERQRLASGDVPIDSPIQVYGLRKVFGTFVAVDNVSFHVPKGQCFGMLGPNGAGKTTTISMLTGLLPVSAGGALVAGNDLSTELKDIYANIGICPQFDICWPELTISEHLRFYARIKGVAPGTETAEIESLIRDIGLVDAHKARRTSQKLSGGMRRRLSLAIALVGGPPVVFLDEPTTGLDPETKRNIWALIDRFKRDRCVILTTHSMDEADALCSRIGIMSHGRLRCIGENLHLKNVYGNGYKVDVRYDIENQAQADAFMRQLLPEARLEEAHPGVAVYQIQKQGTRLSSVIRGLQTRPASAGIKDYGIRQTSLEEVFLKIARESEAAFQAKAKK